MGSTTTFTSLLWKNQNPLFAKRTFTGETKNCFRQLLQDPECSKIVTVNTLESFSVMKRVQTHLISIRTKQI